jgi:hypothetical protein
VRHSSTDRKANYQAARCFNDETGASRIAIIAKRTTVNMVNIMNIAEEMGYID